MSEEGYLSIPTPDNRFDSFGRDGQTGTYSGTWRTGVAPSIAVITAIALIEEKSPLEVEALYSLIDPDALDTIIGTKTDTDTSVSFSIDGYGVTVDTDSQIVLTKPDREARGNDGGIGDKGDERSLRGHSD